MKNFTFSLLIFVLLLPLNYTNAQCPSGDVHLSNQTEVDAYRVGYPNCTQINGSLNIGAPNSNIYDLSGLESINTIMGNLTIIDNNGLTNVHGLDQLLHIEGNVYIRSNQNIANLAGLNKLETVNGDLKFQNNASLVTIGGMQDLISVGADMEISDNEALADLNAFSKLTTVGGYFTIRNNPELEDIDEFTKLGVISGNLAINQNNLIENLEGLRSLVTLGGNFTILQNQNLMEIGDLNPAMQPSAILRIAFNFNLSDCAAQAFCDHVSNNGDVDIINNGFGCSTLSEIENSCASTLPVELSDFHVEVNNKDVLLTWQTLTENNNEGFEIQRSNNGLNWETIGWQAGRGDATTARKYTFTDNRPIIGKSYYRLAQSDFDGKIEYSEIVIVSFYHDTVSVYPNPVSDVLRITVADDMPIESIVVYNTSGSEVMRETSVTSDLNIARLDRGTYVIAIQVDGETTRKKLIVE